MSDEAADVALPKFIVPSEVNFVLLPGLGVVKMDFGALFPPRDDSTATLINELSEEDFRLALITDMLDAATRSISRGYGTVGTWLTGGAAATFALAIANTTSVINLCGDMGLKVLLWSSAVCVILGIWQKFLFVLSEGGRDAGEQMEKSSANSGVPMAKTVRPMPAQYTAALVNALPWHLKAGVQKIAQSDRYENAKTGVRRAELHRVLVLIQAACAVVGMVGPMLLSMMQ
jgi:hypothetical protein